jgi:patatin-like phospholipase/acyl hydrolase
MEQANATMTGGNDDPLETQGLCLLSLDGGGVRGLSTLYILKGLMDQLSAESPDGREVKPCEVFDLIGGTSTGGLIAIMLGRLELSVDECIEAYTDLMARVFKHSKLSPVSLTGNVRARFDSKELEKAIQEVIISRGGKETDKLNDGSKRGCKV